MMRDLITIVEEAGTTPAFLYHGTTTRALRRILDQGMASPSHWTTRQDIAEWFAGHKAKDKGGKPVLITLPWSAFDPNTFAPDLNLMDFPIPHHDAEHDVKLDALANPQEPTWQESLTLFDAVIVNAMLYIQSQQVKLL